MDYVGLAEDPFGEDAPMGLVLTPKECRNRIMLDLGILVIPKTGFFSESFSSVRSGEYWRRKS